MNAAQLISETLGVNKTYEVDTIEGAIAVLESIELSTSDRALADNYLKAVENIESLNSKLSETEDEAEARVIVGQINAYLDMAGWEEKVEFSMESTRAKARADMIGKAIATVIRIIGKMFDFAMNLLDSFARQYLSQAGIISRMLKGEVEKLEHEDEKNGKAFKVRSVTNFAGGVFVPAASDYLLETPVDKMAVAMYDEGIAEGLGNQRDMEVKKELIAKHIQATFSANVGSHGGLKKKDYGTKKDIILASDRLSGGYRIALVGDDKASRVMLIREKEAKASNTTVITDDTPKSLRSAVAMMDRRVKTMVDTIYKTNKVLNKKKGDFEKEAKRGQYMSGIVQRQLTSCNNAIRDTYSAMFQFNTLQIKSIAAAVKAYKAA